MTYFYRFINSVRWWHLLWILFFLSGLVFRQRGTEEIQVSVLDLWALFRITLVGIIALTLIALFLSKRIHPIRILANSQITWMMLYVIFSIISTIWSIFPEWTLYKSVEYSVGVLLAAVIVTKIKINSDIKILFDITWVMYSVLGLTVLLGVLVWPQEAILRDVGILGDQIQGVFPAISANSVGEIGAILSIISIIRIFLYFKKSHLLYFLILILGLFLLVFSQSRTPLIGFAIAMLVIFYVNKKKKVLIFAVFLLITIFMFTPLGNAVWLFVLRGESDVMLYSLTGRTFWWNLAWTSFIERPWWGYGAYAGGRFGVLAASGNNGVSTLHNAWLEILLGSGLIGLSFVLGAVLSTWFIILRYSQSLRNRLSSQLTLEALACLVIITLRSMFSSAFIWHPATIWLMILGYAVFLQRRSNFMITPIVNR